MHTNYGNIQVIGVSLSVREMGSRRSLLMNSKFVKPPIIIGGCGRSGTSVLLSILSAHPRIFAIPFETQAFCPTAYTNKLDMSAPFEVKEISEYLSNAEVPNAAWRWCEKTPKNILFFGRILEYFGRDVRLINIVRDGRDVILSQHPNNPDRFYVPIDRWVDEVKAGMPFGSHPQVHVVYYEDLVNQPEKSIADICDFLDEDVDPAILDWHVHATVRKHSAWKGEVEQLHRGSLKKWESSEYRQRLADLLSDVEAVRLLKYYGYMDQKAKPAGNWRIKFTLKKAKRRIPAGIKTRIKEDFPFFQDFFQEKICGRNIGIGTTLAPHRIKRIQKD